jgi:hypothetical protein
MSWLGLRLLQGVVLVLFLLLAGTVPSSTDTSDAHRDNFLRQTTDGWCAAHGKRDDLQAVVVDVDFHAEPPHFAQGEGTVVAPLAIDLPGAQRVLDVAARPAHLRKLRAGGITALAWEYGGRVHRRMRFRGVALVERPPLRPVAVPVAPSYEDLPADLLPEFLARVSDLEEHRLQSCAAFPGWAARTAQSPPHTAQIERLVRAVSVRAEENRQGEDLCADIRAGRFTPHRAQVTAVMAAREAGIPAAGFASASGDKIYLVGTYLDGVGWIFMDVERPAEGWFTGGPALLTMAPVLGGFSASQHDFWSPAGAAYTKEQWGFTTLSSTQWRATLRDKGAPTDTTEARSIRLSEACR